MKISNAVLFEKIENMHEDVKEIKEAVKANTEFRLQAKGIIGVVSFICTGLGGFLVWAFQKIGGK